MQASIVLHEIERTTSRGSRELRENRLFTGDLGQTRPKPLVVEFPSQKCNFLREPLPASLYLEDKKSTLLGEISARNELCGRPAPPPPSYLRRTRPGINTSKQDLSICTTKALHDSRSRVCGNCKNYIATFSLQKTGNVENAIACCKPPGPKPYTISINPPKPAPASPSPAQPPDSQNTVAKKSFGQNVSVKTFLAPNP